MKEPRASRMIIRIQALLSHSLDTVWSVSLGMVTFMSPWKSPIPNIQTASHPYVSTREKKIMMIPVPVINKASVLFTYSSLLFGSKSVYSSPVNAN